MVALVCEKFFVLLQGDLDIQRKCVGHNGIEKQINDALDTTA